MDTSTLSIVVKSAGISSAVTALAQLANNANLANNAVGNLNTTVASANTSLNSLASIQSSVQASTNAALQAMNNFSGAFGQLNTNINAAVQNMNALVGAMAQFNTAHTNSASAINTTNRQSGLLNNTLKSMAVAASAYVSINFAKEVISQADAWGQMQAKLKLATGSMEGAKVAQANLLEIAQRIRIPLEDSVQLYNRMALPMMALGKSSKETMGIVEGMGYALKLSGATAQEASSVMLQFSQSMNAGRLNGAEFNAVAEGAPLILRAIEAELIRTGRGAELATKGLKKMGSEGSLGAKLLSDAINNAKDQMQKDFESLPLTVDGAMTRIKNSWLAALGKVSEDTKFNEKIAAAVSTLEASLPVIAKAVASTMATLVENAGKIVTVIEAVITTGFIVWLGRLIPSLVAATGAFTALAGSVGIFNAAMATLGINPITIALGALVVAGYAAYRMWDEHTTQLEKARVAKENMAATIPNLVQGMKAETAELEKQVDVLRRKVGLPTLYDAQQESDKKFSKQAKDYEKLTQATIELANAKAFAKVASDKFESENEKYKGIFIQTTYLKGLKKEATDAAKALEQSQEAFKDVEEQAKKQDVRKDQVANTAAINKAISVSGQIKDTIGGKDAKEIAKLEQQIAEGKQVNLDLDARRATMSAEELEAAKKVYFTKEQQLALEKKISEIKAPAKAPKMQQAQLDDLDKANIRLAEQIELTKQYYATGGDTTKLTAGEKENDIIQRKIELLQESISAGKQSNVADAKRLISRMQESIAINEQATAEQRAREAITSLNAEREKGFAKQKATIDSTAQELEKAKYLYENYGKVEKTLAEVALAKEQVTLATMKGQQGSEKEVAMQEVIIQNLKDTIELDKKLDTVKYAEKIGKQLDDMLDPTKAQKFGDSFTDSMGKVGKAISQVSKVFMDMGRQQAIVEKQQRLATEKFMAGGDQVAYEQDLGRIREQNSKDQITNFGNLLEASKGFFDEQSKGYRVVDGISKVFHAVQLARNIASTASGIIAGAAQMFAQGGLYGFAGVAAMGVVMAGLGYAMSGSSSNGGISAADQQKTQGTGTVFGDSSVKSDSISKSIDLLSKNSSALLPINQGMLSALRNIESSMIGLTNLVIRTNGITEGTNLGIQTGQLNKGMPTDFISKVATNITQALFGPGLGGAIAGFINNLWGKTTQTIVDSGIQFSGPLKDLQAGKGINQYASVDTTTSSLFGLIKNTSNSMQTQGLTKELSDQFGMIFVNVENALKLAAKGLGSSADDVAKTLESFNLVTTSVSLKGLKGDALTKELNAVISKATDDIARAAFPEMDKYRLVGEGYAETVLRVSNTVSVVNETFKSLGFKMFDLNAAGVAAAMGFSQLFSSMDNFQAVTQKYYQDYYSASEKLGIETNRLTQAFEEAGLGVLPKTKEEFRKLVETIQATGDPEKLAAVLSLSDAFTSVGNAAQDLADKQMSQQIEVLNLQGKTSEVLALTRANELDAMDESLRPMQKRIYALQDEATAAEKAKELASRKGDLDIQILELQNKHTEALALTRARELAEMDKSLIPLQERVYALQDEAEALAKAKALADKKFDLDIQILELTDHHTQAVTLQRQKELAEMDASLRPLQERIYALQDEKEAVDRAKKALEEKAKYDQMIAETNKATDEAMRAADEYKISKQKEVTNIIVAEIDKQISVYEDLASKFAATAKAAKALKESLLTGNLTTLSPEESYRRTKNNLQGTISLAKSGDSDAMSQLQQFLEISKGYNASTQAYTDDFNTVTSALDDIASYSDTQEAIAKAQLQALNSQKDLLTGVNGNLVTINTTLLNLPTSVAGIISGATNAAVTRATDLTAAQRGQKITTFDASSTMVGDVNDVAARALAAQGSELRQKAIADVYKRYRESETAYGQMVKDAQAKGYKGTEFDYSQEFGGRFNLEEELKKATDALYLAANPNGSHATGLDSVPFDGYIAKLHQGESVVPAGGVNGMVSGINNLCAQMSEAITELKANVTVNSAGAQMVVEKLETLATKLDDQKRVLART